MSDKAADVLAAFAQRRELNREDAQAIEKVLAEPASVDLFLQVAIGRGNDADIDPAGARVADAFQFLLLQNAQQLCLHRERHFSDFIEKQRAAVGQFEAARLVLQRAGKRASHVTEEFALEQVVGHGAAIHLDEGATLPRALVVSSASDEFLAHTAFSGDEHRCTGRCDKLNLLHHFPQSWTSADDVTEVVFAADFFPQIVVVGLEPGPAPAPAARGP